MHAHTDTTCLSWALTHTLSPAHTEPTQYWNFAVGAWDGRGCIAVGADAVSGKLECHCYHLTDFGGVASDAVPKMSMPDPTNPGAAFKSFSADDITVVVVLGGMLITYWALIYWGWNKDRQEARLAARGLLANDGSQYRKSQEEQRAAELDAAVATNNPELTKRLMRGSFLHKVMALRHRLFATVASKHKLLGAFFAVNSNYTRPRRFTVLFCMLVGNMFVNALWIGSGTQETFIQKALAGVISAFIMFPVSFFFAWIFKNLEISPARQKVRDQRQLAAKAHVVQEVVDAIGIGKHVHGPHGKVIAAPSALIKRRPPRRREWVPAPDFQRIGPGAADPDASISPYKRMTLSSPMVATRGRNFEEDSGKMYDSQDRSFLSVSSVVRETSDLHPEYVGLMLPRRSLPIHNGPHRPAPIPVDQDRRHPHHAYAGSSSDDEQDLNSSVSGASLTSSNVKGRNYQGEPLALPHGDMSEADPDAEKNVPEYTRRIGAQMELDGKHAAAASKATMGYKLAAKAIRKAVMPKRRPAAKVLINHHFQYMAYILATIWYMVCIYFCLLIGISFTKDVADAWILGFVISIVQDLVVMESIKLTTETGVNTLIKPQIISFLAATVASRVPAPPAE